MQPLHIHTSLCVCLLSFENINVYSKGHYLMKIAVLNEGQNHPIRSLNHQQQHHQSQTIHLKTQSDHYYYTHHFTLKYQNQKINLNEFILVDFIPLKRQYKHTLTLKISLLKSNANIEKQQRDDFSHYTQVTTTQINMHYLQNGLFQYFQCPFQQPFSSSLSLVNYSQPVRIRLDIQQYKYASFDQIIFLKKHIKKMRYNNYMSFQKLTKMLDSQQTYQFTLPKLFYLSDSDMEEVPCTEEQFWNYLLIYEQVEMTLEQMNIELQNISAKNHELVNLFTSIKEPSKLEIDLLQKEYLQKTKKRHQQFVFVLPYKPKYIEEYAKLHHQKIKSIKKGLVQHLQNQAINNIVVDIENPFVDHKIYQKYFYPIVTHQVETKKEQPSKVKEMQKFVFIFAHGYQGTPDDLYFLANGIKRVYKKSKFLILKSYKHKMELGISQMADYAAEEILNYFQQINYNQKPLKIVFVGHSMGGLVLRSCLKQFIKYTDYLECFISLATPHLGFVQGTQFLIKAGLKFFSSIHQNKCLDEISNQDNKQLRQTFIYKLSQSGNLRSFNKIVLVTSIHDNYAPWHSARLQSYNSNFLKPKTFLQQEMIETITNKRSKFLNPSNAQEEHSSSRISRIDRIEVEFQLKQNNLDKFIGRSSHIRLLTDLCFIQLFSEACLPSILL